LNTKVLILSAVMGLTACGGGGDDAPAPAPAPAPSTSPSNAKPLALSNYGDIAERAVESLAAGDLLSSAAFPAQAVAPARALSGLASGDAATIAQSLIREVIKGDRKKARIASVDRYSEPCDRSGSISVTENDSDNNGKLSAGDSASFVFQNCTVMTGLPAVNGRIDIRINAAQLDRDDEFVAGSFNMSISNFESDGNRLNGSVDATLSASSMVLSYRGLTLSNSKGTVRYNFIQTLGLTDNSLRVNGDLVIDGTSYQLSTPVTLRSGSGNFSSGTLRVTDPSNGYAEVVMSPMSYKVNLYLPGDSVVDATKIVAW
jgi:hypothetical protein